VTEPAVPAELKTSTSTPRVINVDKNAASPKAIADLKAAGRLPERVELRQVKYLNHLAARLAHVVNCFVVDSSMMSASYLWFSFLR
jgi:transposase-like protein